MEPVGPNGQTIPFSSSNNPQSSQLVPTGKWAHLEIQTSLKQLSPPFCRFSCSIVHGFLVIRNSGFFLPNFFIDFH
ncbi:hypothetical protein H5410_051859 [Solanum commersonii]|uniref:Uncharacterized protein n=1 Tax=Solanum commersonii TaxID=4109 RepID=A0A9J5X2A3_SOLCO|nr:hypothetical protein H5410_051859 [Solanum commersonii]